MNVTLENVSAVFGKKYAVKHIIQELTPGLYGLIGPNGAGKSTLIRMILGLQKPTDGRVLVDGVDISRLDSGWRKQVGYVPQENVFYPEFTTMEYLRYMQVIKEEPFSSENAEYLEQLMELLHLTDYRFHRMKHLSGGTLRRVMIAAALIGRPKLLIFDEPSAGLDPMERINMRNIIAGLSEGRTVILATHIAADIECIADEVLVMKEGSIIVRDAPQKLLERVRPKIWEKRIDRQEIQELAAQNITATFLQTEQGFTMRSVEEADNPNPVDGTTLDEVYLYYTMVKPS